MQCPCGGRTIPQSSRCKDEDAVLTYQLCIGCKRIGGEILTVEGVFMERGIKARQRFNELEERAKAFKRKA